VHFIYALSMSAAIDFSAPSAALYLVLEASGTRGPNQPSKSAEGGDLREA
jgi:hypothetical protein